MTYYYICSQVKIDSLIGDNHNKKESFASKITLMNK